MKMRRRAKTHKRRLDPRLRAQMRALNQGLGLAVRILAECLRMRPNAQLQAPLKKLSEHLQRSQHRRRSQPMTAAELLAMRGSAAIEFEAPTMQLELKSADFDADYAHFQSPEYARLAREAERTVPTPRFRRFGKPRDK